MVEHGLELTDLAIALAFVPVVVGRFARLQVRRDARGVP
jgi:hypothetical protein